MSEEVRPLEFKSVKTEDVDKSGRTIVGHAAVFGNIDSYGDIIERGAFERTLTNNGGRVKVFYNHMHPIGRPMKMEEDDYGLYTEAYISKTPMGDEILQLVEDKAIDEMSIAFETIRSEENADGNRMLKELKLYEFGPVSMAANEQAVITGVKNLTDELRRGRDLNTISMKKIKDAISMLKSLLDAGPSEQIDTPQSDSSLIDTQMASKLKSDWIADIADASKTIKGRL